MSYYNPRLYLLPLCLLTFSSPAFTQSNHSLTEQPGLTNPVPQPELYDRLLVNASPSLLMSLGLAADHGIRHYGKGVERAEITGFESDFSRSERAILDQEQIAYEVLIADVSSFYRQRAERDSDFYPDAGSGSDAQHRDASEFVIPADFVPGSMAAYYTMQEVYNQLDSMAARYPHLVSNRTVLGPNMTHQGRQQYVVKISDNVHLDESDEPNVLYTALMHAREPGGMMCVIFYMQWLLENYGIDPRATFVINNTQMYFVPVLNPDGYEINRISNPTGGGMWRKNARNNGSSTGVDLNRNWPHEWGYDDVGSSTNPASDVYRGPAPGSEPELMNLIAFANERNFRTALNYHSFGELLIYPWGYDVLITPDHSNFRRAAKAMTEQNFYRFGLAYQTVGYVANGVSDDWFYAEQTTKDKTFAFTPEVGILGFWPPPAQIIPIAQENALANLLIAFYATRYDALADASAEAFAGATWMLKEDQHHGLDTEFSLTGLEWQLWPNPASGPVSIRLSTQNSENPDLENLELRVFDNTGAQRASLRLQNGGTLNLPELPAGVYWVELLSGSGQSLGRQSLMRF